MATIDNCPICDRPQASTPLVEAQCHVARVRANLEIPTSRLGWIETEHTRADAERDCAAHAVDWRARYLESERQLANERATLVAMRKILAKFRSSMTAAMLMFALVALVACGGAAPGPGPDGGELGDAGADARLSCLGGTCELPDADPAAPDATITPPDAGAARGPGAACDLLADQCVAGYTCRYTATPSSPFVCQAVGPGGEGADCSSSGDAGCGADLGCFPSSASRSSCYRFCDTSSPALRCAAAQQCESLASAHLPAEFPATTGVCL